MNPGDTITFRVVGGTRTAIVESNEGNSIIARQEKNGRRVHVNRSAIVGVKKAVLPEEEAAMRPANVRPLFPPFPSKLPLESLEGLKKAPSARTLAPLRAVPKDAPADREAAYLDFVRSHPCTFCHAPGPSDAHHWGHRGVGQKTSDYRTLPLCRKHHDYYHHHGRFPAMDALTTKLAQQAAQLDLLIAWIRKAKT